MPAISNELTAVWNAYAAGKLDLALRFAEAALGECDEDGPLWQLRGLIHRDRGEVEACIDALERASLLVPLDAIARVCLAGAYGKTGSRELARDLFVSMFADDAMSVDLFVQVAAGLDAIDQPRLAMKACRIAAEREPERSQLYYDMGFYAARCGYPVHVVEALARRAIALEPSRVNYRVGLASLLAKHDRLDEAREIVAGIAPRQLAAICCRCCLERIAAIFESAGDFARAAECRARLERLADAGGDGQTC